jgi:hypothetical protein
VRLPIGVSSYASRQEAHADRSPVP